jgi:adenylosuccinate lyase
MIPRYSRRAMAVVWEPENRFRKWLQIEVWACEAMAKRGKIPAAALRTIQRKVGFDIERIGVNVSDPRRDTCIWA